jgi:hypothetical protein
MKIAIITYCYSDKSNTVSGLRPESWAKYLSEKGFDVTVFTRDWQWGDGSAPLLLNSTDYNKEIITYLEKVKIIYLPYRKKWYTNPPVFKKLVNTIMAFAGRYGSEADITQWCSHIHTHQLAENYTHVISSCHPYTTLLLTRNLQKKIPDCKYIVDFRDYYNNHLLKTDVVFNPFSKLVMNVQAAWITHYIKNLYGVITASESISEKFTTVHHFAETTTILNGFESEIFNQFTPEKNPEYFTVSLIGALFSGQDNDFMLEGMLQFLGQLKSTDHIRINFIGLEYNPDVSDKVKNALLEFKEVVNITARIERYKALQIMNNSTILFYVGWKGWKGIYSGKIFEYLGAKKNILIAPNDHDVLEKLINYTNTGKLADTPGEMSDILMQWYNEWLQHGKLKYQGIEERIAEFTREAQAEKLLLIL